MAGSGQDTSVKTVAKGAVGRKARSDVFEEQQKKAAGRPAKVKRIHLLNKKIEKKKAEEKAAKQAKKLAGAKKVAEEKHALGMIIVMRVDQSTDVALAGTRLRASLLLECSSCKSTYDGSRMAAHRMAPKYLEAFFQLILHPFADGSTDRPPCYRSLCVS